MFTSKFQLKSIAHHHSKSELFSSFGDAKTSFFKDITACQILVAINIIAKLSFFIKKPIQASILDALDQFKTQDYAEKLKIQMTSKSIPSDEDDLYTFLYEQITTHVTQ
ncbi:hypothetical protein F5887DRAFT_1080852 [Amanita rubescens]|nr:hypothetical protein F5887DRAFT_1080852 [Amanita rubescens]